MTRSQLVYLPGFPYTSATLMPKQPLAATAAVLLADGHDVQVRDEGTLFGLEALLSKDLRNILAAAARTPGHALARDLRKRLIAAHRRRAAEVADEVACAAPDWIMIYLPRHRDWGVGQCLAAELRHRCPGLPILGAGDFASNLAHTLMSEDTPFTGICHSCDIEPTALAFARAVAKGQVWTEVKALSWRRGGYLQQNPDTEAHGVPIPPVTCYTPAVYPVASGAGQYHVAMLEDARGCTTAAYASPQGRGRGESLRVKPAAVTVEEVLQSCNALHTRVCHFVGYGAQSIQLQALSRRLAMIDMGLIYSRRLHPAHVNPSDMAVLQASGCRAVGLRLDSGSQRLLEDYYGHRFTVSEFEALMLTAKRYGIEASVDVTYPSPADDGHTRDETLRLLRRTAPASVQVGGPTLWPGALWFEQSKSFGFSEGRASYGEWTGSSPAGAGSDPAQSVLSRAVWRRPRSKAPIHEPLTRALHEDRIAVGLSELDLLVGQVLGDSDANAALAAHRALQAADISGIAERVDRFNTSAAPLSARAGLQRFIPVYAVVGN